MIDTSLSPYFDDYNEKKNFSKILFTPRRAVQVRELNQLQSMLQAQVQRFGDHIFQDGSMVIPGESNYDLAYEYVTLSGVDYSQIVETLITNDVFVIGQTSGVTARVVQHLGNTVNDPVTFYLQYTDGSGTDVLRFEDGEQIQLRTALGVDFALATVIGTGQGSVLTVQAGIFYIAGNFIRTDDSRIVMSKYSTEPSVVAGFRLKDELVDWTTDPSLLDNASGTSNQNAIGADRLKLTLELEVYGINETFDAENFIELVRFNQGVLQKKARGPEYNILNDVLARRTYDESGDYTVSPFNIRVLEHLKEDDNGGLYSAPFGDESKFVVGVEPGKAYVRGYEVENLTTVYVDADKARDTSSINNGTFSLPVGNYIEVTGMNRIPLSNSFQKVTFYSGTPASPGSIPSGTVLGSARVRQTELDPSVGGKGVLYLFDIRNAANANDSSFIDNAGSVYMAGTPAFTAIVDSELIDSINYGLTYKLPINNVKTLLSSGVSDTSYSLVRQYQVTADSSGVVVLTAGTNEVFATPTANNSAASFTNVSSVPVVRNLVGISTLGGVPTGSTLTLDFGAPAASRAITINVEIVKQIGIHKSKTVSTASVTRTPGDMASRKFKLGKADVFKIVSITENGVDKSGAYVLHKNITPEYYGVSEVELKASEGIPANNVTIEFQYFVHGTGNFFSVDSYASIDYADIPTEIMNNVPVSMSDVVDFRPRIDDTGANFTGTGASIVEVPSPYSLIRCDIEHYLPRIDKVYVTAKGNFGVIKGVPALSPKEPTTPDNAMALYVLQVPAYTKNVRDIQSQFINNRRYTMRDIGKLEERLANVEYYTTLNMLETETNGMQIVDPVTGLNRFKNGFVTDNFVDHSVGAYTYSEYKCAISTEEGILRPEFGMDQVDVAFDPSTSTGVVLTGSLVTLPYSEVVYMSQPMASKYVNVNPYAVYLWSGSLRLTPSNDTWFDNVYTEPEVQYNVFNNGVLTQQWNSWGLNWTGGTTVSSTSRVIRKRMVGVFTTTTNTSIQVVNDREISRSVIPFMRSRDVVFNASGLMPNSRVYAIFDNVDVTQFCKQNGKNFGQPMFANDDGEISGVFNIPNTPQVRFRTGTKQFTLIDNPAGEKIGSLSYADTNYSAAGTLVTRTQSIVATRSITNSVRYIDPLAQSFLVEKSGGVFLTSIESWFASKDDSIPVTLEIRNMVNGYPGPDVVPYSRVTMKPEQVSVSADATAATKFVFESPVYLVDGQEYCFVLLSNSNNYNAFVAEMGGREIGTTNYITKQPFTGVLFKSQNNTTWTADQQSDLKFRINAARFNTSVNGIAAFKAKAPDVIRLENNGLSSTSGSNAIVVNLKDHGMVVGSKVQIAGVVTAPGIAIGQLNALHDVTAINGPDSFTVNVTSNANATGSFGGSAVTCSKSMMANTIQPVVQELLFENTNVDWSFSGIMGKSLNGTESAYSLIPEFYITPNENNDVSVPLMFLSSADATDKSMVGVSTLKANMVSYADNISPAIDLNGLGIIGVTNRINAPTVLTETAATGGNAIARYLTNVLGLKNAANSIKIYVDVNKPQGSDVKIFYRVGNTSEEVEGKEWAILDNPVSSVATDRNSFLEFEFGKESLQSFSFYQFKIVMTSESSSSVPRLRRFRGIALGT